MNRIKRSVHLNPNFDSDLIEFAKNINFSKFVKDALRAEMKKGKDVDYVKDNIPKFCKPLPTQYFQTKQGILIYFRLFSGVPHKWTLGGWQSSSIQKTKLIDILW